MVTIGADCHKESHTLVAVDPVGRKIAEVTVSNRPTSYTQVLTWAQQLDAERVWGIENSGSFGRALAQYLVGQDERVYEVNPQLTGRKRRTSLARDKSDPPDALAIGRVVLQEGEHLPQVQPEDLSSILSVVVEHRDNLGEERTRLLNQLHTFCMTEMVQASRVVLYLQLVLDGLRLRLFLRVSQQEHSLRYISLLLTTWAVII